MHCLCCYSAILRQSYASTTSALRQYYGSTTVDSRVSHLILKNLRSLPSLFIASATTPLCSCCSATQCHNITAPPLPFSIWCFPVLLPCVTALLLLFSCTIPQTHTSTYPLFIQCLCKLLQPSLFLHDSMTQQTRRSALSAQPLSTHCLCGLLQYLRLSSAVQHHGGSATGHHQWHRQANCAGPHTQTDFQSWARGCADCRPPCAKRGPAV